MNRTFNTQLQRQVGQQQQGPGAVARRPASAEVCAWPDAAPDLIAQSQVYGYGAERSVVQQRGRGVQRQSINQVDRERLLCTHTRSLPATHRLTWDKEKKRQHFRADNRFLERRAGGEGEPRFHPAGWPPIPA